MLQEFCVIYSIKYTVVMINNFEIWNLFESLGDGTESFSEKIDLHGKLRNLDIDGCPSEWGIEIDDANGEMTYSIELDVNRSGLESVNFYLEEIKLQVDVVTGYDEDEFPVIETKEFVVQKKDIKTDVKVEINHLPFFLQNLTIDFRHAENLDGDLLMDKIVYSMEIGNIER
jgi:hypothetical protein